MFNVQLVLFGICVIIEAIRAQLPSPCPEVLKYESRGAEQDRWYGVISLQTDEPLEGIWLRITLDHTAELLGNWFGDSSTQDNKEFTIRNSGYKLERGPSVSVRFFIKYNTADTIPSVTKIRLNGKVVCLKGGEEVTATTPKLHISQFRPTSSSSSSSSSSSGNNNGGNLLNHNGQNNRRPSGSSINNHSGNNNNNNNRHDEDSSSSSSSSSSNSGNSGGGSSGTKQNNYNGLSTIEDENSSTSILSSTNGFDFFPGDFNIRPSSSTLSRPSSSQSNNQKRNSACGTVGMRASPLISFGQNTSQGDWPWHAALFYTQQAQLLYTCGGTLVSENHILTAAHCVTKPQSNRAIDSKILSVYLGKYSLKKFGTGVQDREVSSIFVHPQYNYSVYFNDIAILKVDKPLEITNLVRPCCLWQEDSNNIEDVENKLGTVVGWGFDENRKISDTLMQTQMPIVSTIKCIYSNRDFFSQFTFDKNFCAGFRNGTSVCNGDSGGGMVFPKSGTSGRSTVWQIRGIVSVSVALQGQAVCDSSHYIVFTDVAKHLSWIKKTMSESQED